MLEKVSRVKNERRPQSIRKDEELLCHVTGAGTEVCVKGCGSIDERASDPVGTVGTCTVGEGRRSWRNHRGERNWDLRMKKSWHGAGGGVSQKQIHHSRLDFTSKSFWQLAFPLFPFLHFFTLLFFPLEYTSDFLLWEFYCLHGLNIFKK